MLYSPLACLAPILTCRSGETGRRAGLKIPWGSPPVWVRFPPPAPIESSDFSDTTTRGETRRKSSGTCRGLVTLPHETASLPRHGATAVGDDMQDADDDRRPQRDPREQTPGKHLLQASLGARMRSQNAMRGSPKRIIAGLFHQVALAPYWKLDR